MRVKANLIMCSLCILFLLILNSTAYAHGPGPMPPTDPPEIIYVDVDATGANNGSSWENAFNYLQDAITSAYAMDEIRVAQGIYKPDQGLNQNVGDHWASFELVNEVAIKGGYAGFGEPDPNARNVELYETILSGDLQGNDVDVNDTRDLLDEPTRDENSRHILTSSSSVSDTTLDGFVVTGGNGTGLLVTHSELTIINCTFMRNSVRHSGGAIYVENSQPLLVNCKFIDNLAMDFGGAIYSDGSNLTLSECRFIGNCADSGGGMLSFGDGDAVLTSCIFQNNLAWESSGALSHNGGRLELNDCSFSSNIAFFWDSRAGIGGGAVGTGTSEEVVIRGCTFNSNTASYGGAMHGDVDILDNCVFTGNSAFLGGALYGIGDTIIEKCIFAGNRANNGAVLVGGGSVNLESCTFTGNLAQNGTIFASLRTRFGTPTLEMTASNSILWDGDNEIGEFDVSITHSNIQGGWPGEGNVDIDPLFTAPGYWIDVNDPNVIVETDNPNFVLIDGHYYLNYPRYRGEPTNIPIWIDGDYHLKSQAGRYDPNSKSWVVDEVTSPCIDAGDPNSPVAFEPFPNGGIINMGAYGGTPEASKSYFDGLVCNTRMAGDINADYEVDLVDLLTVIAQWTNGVPPILEERPLLVVDQPRDGARLEMSGETILIRAGVYDPDNSIANVSIHVYGDSVSWNTRRGAIQKKPSDWPVEYLEWEWDYDGQYQMGPGQYTIVVEAIDDERGILISPEVKITLLE